MVFELSGQIFLKFSNTKFHENTSSGSGVAPCGRTEKHDKAMCREENQLDANEWFIALIICNMILLGNSPASEF